ncbi:MAG: 5'-3' exonuclease H3TH domain-containing protein, partial [Alphaproteobacteria bacterium]
MGKIYFIDVSGFIFRAFYALPPLKKSDGSPIGAVFGFCQMLVRLLNKIKKDDYAIAIFDSGKRTFRNDLYPLYKANRPPPPDDLVAQFPMFFKVCEAFSLSYVVPDGFEADDLIASYVVKASKDGYEGVIVSSDKDLMQLVDNDITMWDPLKDRMIDENVVLEKFGVEPKKVAYVLALSGDASDNVKGISGIGPKTASKLIKEYGSLESLLQNANLIKQQKCRESLITYADDARLSYKLVSLVKDIPLPLNLEKITTPLVKGDKIKKFLLEQGFITILNRLQGNEDKENSYNIVTSKEDLNKWIDKINRLGVFAFDIYLEETSIFALSIFEKDHYES